MICEYTGVAETEEYAHDVLAGNEAPIGKDDGATLGVPFVIQTPAQEFSAKTDDNYNYAPVTIK